jgi:hypothetical protein
VELYQRLPPEVLKIALVLFLSFLIGLEREEHKVAVGSGFGMGFRVCSARFPRVSRRDSSYCPPYFLVRFASSPFLF